MVLSKQDLQEWHSNPVTRELFSKIKREIEDERSSSAMMPTVDETALKTAYNEGFIDGASALTEAYSDALEEA